MNPEEFAKALNDLTAALAVVVTLPLDEMSAYVDLVEETGEGNPAFTQERRETTTHVARIIAAATYLRTTTAMGGRL